MTNTDPISLHSDKSMILEKAIEIACRAHQGQRDKAGVPYILHPLRVMLQLDNIDERK